MKTSFETKLMSNKLLQDELINAKLYDNQSFQYILDREMQRRIKYKNNLLATSKK